MRQKHLLRLSYAFVNINWQKQFVLWDKISIVTLVFGLCHSKLIFILPSRVCDCYDTFREGLTHLLTFLLLSHLITFSNRSRFKVWRISNRTKWIKQKIKCRVKRKFVSLGLEIGDQLSPKLLEKMSASIQIRWVEMTKYWL